MGKAGRRKKNRQRRKEQRLQSSDPIGIATPSGDGASSTVVANPHSAVQKLRNPDPKVRHAALVALQASVLSQIHHGNGNSHNKQVSLKVLQAVREQVTAGDLECAAVAAECLSQYLATVSASSQTQRNADQQKQTTASWALVLLGRLGDCRRALQELLPPNAAAETISKNQRKKRDKIKKQWFALAAPCFTALCQLIEDNGHALDQINLQKQRLVEVVFGMLSLVATHQQQQQIESNNNNSNNAAEASAEATAMDEGHEAAASSSSSTPQDAMFAKLVDTTALYAARSLHSALDDNGELAGALTHGENQSVWKHLLGSANNSGQQQQSHALSATTRLHLVGCLVNLYQLSSGSQPSSSSWIQELLVEYGIRGTPSAQQQNCGLLFEVLHSTGPDVPPTAGLASLLQAHHTHYTTAQALLEQQQTDQRLEAEVDAKVQARKEPAKLIARRQKKIKAAKREAFREQQKARMIAEAEKAEQDTDMVDASDEAEDTEKAQEETPKADSGKLPPREQDGEEARNEALSAWTNVTGPIQLSLEIMTNLLSTWIYAPPDESNQALGATVQGQQIAERLTESFRTLAQFLRKPALRDDANPHRDPIRDDAEETIEKVSACLVNCFLSGMVAGDAAAAGVFQAVYGELGQGGRKSVLDAGCAVLAVAVQMNPNVLNALANASQALELFRNLLPRADAVSLLSSSVLRVVTQDSPENSALVQSLTETFVGLLKQPNDIDPRTTTSILKTFMDWYGNDNFYPNLYQSLGVSPAIEGALKSIARATETLDLDEEQMQILHNSERFLDYKKQFHQR